MISRNPRSGLLGRLFCQPVSCCGVCEAELPDTERTSCALYCDEFQEFATPDFAKLFTQTGKFKIMPAVAHQLRGQFRPNDPNRAATLGAPNIILFQLTTPDARELAPEFGEEPPETRPEPHYAISQYPVQHLLDGHRNPQIREFVNRYLRTLQEAKVRQPEGAFPGARG